MPGVGTREVATRFKGAQKGTFYFFELLRGRPRGRRVDCRPSVVAASFVQRSLPEDLPRQMQARIAATSRRVLDTRRTERGFYQGGWGTVWVWVTEYKKTENPAAKELLYQYAYQDLGYDQALWRAQVLQPLQQSRR